MSEPKKLKETIVRGVSIADAAEYLGCTKQTISYHLKQGNLKAEQVGRQYLIYTWSLRAFEATRELEAQVAALDDSLAQRLAEMIVIRASEPLEDPDLEAVRRGKTIAPDVAKALLKRGLTGDLNGLDEILGPNMNQDWSPF